MGGSRSRQNNSESRQLERNDSDESIDLAALLYELEMASAAHASAGDAAAEVGRERNGTPVPPSNSRAMEVIRDRERRLELLQVRMQMLFGQQQEASQQQESNISSSSLPRSPLDTSTPNLEDGVRTPGTGTSAQGTPNSRRLEVRQARNSPNAARRSYSIDPDFALEDSDESSEADARGAHRSGADGIAVAGDDQDDEDIVNTNLRSIESTTEALRTLLRHGTADEINAASDAIPTSSAAMSTPPRSRSTAAGTPVIGATAAGSSGTGKTSSSSRRMARMAQRAEEEAALNRAILMSIQENQTPDRRASSTDASGEAPAASSATEPSEADVGMLVSMGFTREQSLQALVENRMNVELAANRLLGIDF